MRQLKIYYRNNKLHMELDEDGIVKCISTFTEDADIIGNFVDMNKIDFVVKNNNKKEIV